MSISKLTVVGVRHAGRVEMVKDTLCLCPELMNCEWCRSPLLPAETVYLVRATGISDLTTYPPTYNLCEKCTSRSIAPKKKILP